MGLNTGAAFYGTDNDAVLAGDVAMLAPEVTPVLKALRANGIDVVAIHHHMTDTNPDVYFLHYWGKGQAQKLARREGRGGPSRQRPHDKRSSDEWHSRSVCEGACAIVRASARTTIAGLRRPFSNGAPIRFQSKDNDIRLQLWAWRGSRRRCLTRECACCV